MVADVPLAQSVAHHPSFNGDLRPTTTAPASVKTDTEISERDISTVLWHWPLLLVLGAFLGTAFIIPVFTDAPVGDDWVYTRSVETLLRTGRLEILDLSVVTLVFQVFWGSFFSLILGISFGAMRLSTLLLVLFSGAAFYGLCRELGLERGRAALGAAAYLFNPLTFVLAYTFMTDGQFTALAVIATFLYVRGLNPSRLDPLFIILGSAVAALAFLTRQQGALIPLAVGCYLLLARRWRLDRDSLKLTLWVAGIPALAVGLYYLWLATVHGTPEQQELFAEKIITAGWDDTRLLIGRLTQIEMVYLGFFVLPIAAAVLPSINRWRLPVGWPGIALLLVWTGALLVGLRLFGESGRLMPYIPQFVGTHGVGPTDLHGGRQPVIDPSWRDALTTICAASLFVFILLISRRLDDTRPSPTKAAAGLVAAIALWQVLGILPPSFHFRNWIISVDRYLLPMVPFGIALLLWASRSLPLVRPIGWLVVGAYALFSVVATRDFVVFQGATWDMARTAIASGVPLTRLDAGASWDGYYLYEYSLANGIPQQTPSGPWWTNLFGPATDSSYIVASGPVAGYDPIFVREYSSWLHDEPQLMYLLRRHGVTGPP